MNNVLHIYGQHQWHDEAHIVGNKEALQLLADAINHAISGVMGNCQSSINDGEGFYVYIRRIDDQETLDKLAVPYTHGAAKEKDKSAIWPWILCRHEGCFLCPDCGTPLERSSDMPRGISADKVLIDGVEQTFKDKIKQAIIDTIGSDRPFVDVPDIAEEITQNVMGFVEQNTQGACEYCGTPVNSPNYAYHICASTKKEVVVTVAGGVADVEQIPPGIIVKIRDYDVEGYDEDLLTQDKEGNRYIEAVFTEDSVSYIRDDDDGDPS